MTPAQAMKALLWGLKQCGIDHWNVRLQWTDNRPPWVRVNEDTDGGGRSKSDVSRRTSRIWVGPAGCAASEHDPLVILFHEVRHIALEAAGIDAEGDLVEFDLDRMAEVMAFSYRGGMKPWR